MVRAVAALCCLSGVTASSHFYKAAGGTSCTGIERVTTQSECTAAGTEQGFPFQKVVDALDRPVGCFWDQSGGSYLNTNSAGKTSWAGVGGLCRNSKAYFDVRTAYPGCGTEVLNQGGCGSCWAFGTVHAVSDRFCMHGQKLMLSPQSLVSCSCKGTCLGGASINAYKYIGSDGLQTCTQKCTAGCEPYGSGSKPATCTDDVNNDRCHGCDAQCHDGSRATFHTISASSIVQSQLDGAEAAVMAEIRAHGSVTGGLSVYQNWQGWVKNHGADAVYDTHEDSPHLGAHAIANVGYGESQGKKYWLIKNSWGEGFGDGGFIKMIRGSMDTTIIWDTAIWASPLSLAGNSTAAVPEEAERDSDSFPVTGDWQQGDASHPYFAELAHKAHQQSNARGRFEGLLQVETQVVAGFRARMRVRTSYGDVTLETEHGVEGELLSAEAFSPALV
jgi:cathepsin B